MHATNPRGHGTAFSPSNLSWRSSRVHAGPETRTSQPPALVSNVYTRLLLSSLQLLSALLSPLSASFAPLPLPSRRRRLARRQALFHLSICLHHSLTCFVARRSASFTASLHPFYPPLDAVWICMYLSGVAISEYTS